MLSVVVVSYNTRRFLHACLSALDEHAPPFASEVIVVDNASTDGSAAMVRKHFPDVRLSVSTHNRWFTGGNNLGIAQARGQWVLLLNPDTVVQADALARLVGFMQAHPSYLGATARLVHADGRIQQTCARVSSLAYLLAEHSLLGWMLPGWRRRLHAAHWYEREGWQRDHDHDVEVVPGSCTLMRRKHIWLNPTLRLYFNEDDLSRRTLPLTARPYRFVADAIIEHHEKSATTHWGATALYFRDMGRYVQQRDGWLAFIVLWLLTRPVLWGMWARRMTR